MEENTNVVVATETASETTPVTTAKKARAAATKKAKAKLAPKVQKAQKKAVAAERKANPTKSDAVIAKETAAAAKIGVTLRRYRIMKYLGNTEARRTYVEISKGTGIDARHLSTAIWGQGKGTYGYQADSLCNLGLVRRIESADSGIQWALTAKGAKMLEKAKAPA